MPILFFLFQENALKDLKCQFLKWHGLVIFIFIENIVAEVEICQQPRNAEIPNFKKLDFI